MLTRPEIDSLLQRTSRTFALAIPLLQAPLDEQVGVAYLLFRIADTLEDATLWKRDQRLKALNAFQRWLNEDPSGDAFIAEAMATPPVADESCVALVARANDVRACLGRFAPETAAAIRSHVARTAAGMAEFVGRQDDLGGLVLKDLADLRAYCYVVAGIVGELLSELFVLSRTSLASVRTRLLADAASFGEGLQLVNILKDDPADRREGRVYIPSNVPRVAVTELARADLARARLYVDALREGGAESGTLEFCSLSTQLADATLDSLAAGLAKLPRDKVMDILSEVTAKTR